MKSALYIVAIFSLALVACTERLDVKDVPSDYNGNGATTMVKATVKPLSIEGLDGVGIAGLHLGGGQDGGHGISSFHVALTREYL